MFERSGALFDGDDGALAHAGCRQYDVRRSPPILTRRCREGTARRCTPRRMSRRSPELRSLVRPGASPSASAGNVLEVAAELRDLVIFRELNLFGPWPMKGVFHAIFCRNVVIYFDDDAQAQLWTRFAPCCRKAASSISAIPNG